MKTSELWIFGYGSLIWQPGFPVAERQIARLNGYRRSFCMRSIHHRGTESAPGLVLALDKFSGAECFGMAFRVSAAAENDTMAYLRERELVSSAYLEVQERVTLTDNRTVTAVCYIVDTEHVQYCSGLPLEEQAKIISTAVGGRGPNWEYLSNTATHLATLGIADPDLDWLTARVASLRGVKE